MDFLGSFLHQMAEQMGGQQHQQQQGGAGRAPGGHRFPIPPGFDPAVFQQWATTLAQHPGVDADGWEQPPAEWLQETHEPQRGPPPTAQKFLQRLPDVKVCPEDLAVESSCLICLEEHVVGSTALKLPCNHLFHRDCVTGWLERHCTCPICRFELETEDAAYEAERRKRMRHRKLRYREGELERKGASELKRIFESVGLSSRGCIDKQDMIARLLESGMAEVIKADASTSDSSPRPSSPSSSPRFSPTATSPSSDPTPTHTAETTTAPAPQPSPTTNSSNSGSSTSTASDSKAYTVSGLKQMRIGQLKALMKEAGVSSANCVEKDELVNALIHSGRIVVHADA